MVRFPFIGRLKKVDKNTVIRGVFCVVVVSIGCLLAGMLSLTPSVQRLELDIEDMLLRWSPNHHLHPQIALIGIDRLPQVDRFEQYARVTNALVKAGAQVVAFGFSLEELDPQTRASALLAQITQQNHQIIHAVRMGTGGESLSLLKTQQNHQIIPAVKMVTGSESPSLLKRQALTIQKKISAIYHLEPLKLPPPEILQAASYIGHTAFVLDIDSKIRRVPLIVEYDDQYYPALSLVVACRALNMPLDQVSIQPGKYIHLKRPTGEPIRIPIDKRGQMRIHFAARQMSDFEPESFERIYEAVTGIFPRALTEFKDKIVFLGLTDAKREEPVEVPMSKAFYTVGIHANITNSILTGQSIKEASLLVNGVSLLGVITFLTCLLVFSKLKWYVFLILYCGTFVIFHIGVFALIQTGVLLNVTAPGIGGLVAIGLSVGWRYTEERAQLAEQKREREQAKAIAMTIRGFVHNLGTPLKEIGYCVEDALDSGELKDIRCHLSQIKAHKDSISAIVEQIMSGIGEPELDEFDVTDSLNYALHQIAQLYPEKEIQVVRKYNGPVQIRADRDKLEQLVFHNILLNAYQAMGSKGTLTIQVYSTVARVIFIKIQDTGCGIKKENLPKVTEPGFTTKKNEGGYGMGMWITRYVTEHLHNGKLSLASEEGRGTTVFVELPRFPSPKK